MSEIKNAKEASEKIIKKALTDPVFKKALLANPNGAIEKELDAKLPGGIKVKVLEDSPGMVHLVLPFVSDKGTLSDNDLQNVSGGNLGPESHKPPLSNAKMCMASTSVVGCID